MIVLPCNVPGRVSGVDVSSAQPALPWGLIRANGEAFAYVKATEGMTGRDPMMATHAAGARGVGMLTDFYDFFHSDQDGGIQAENLVRATEKQSRDLRLMVDFEDQQRIKGDPHAALDRLLRHCDRLIGLTGEHPLIYTGTGVIGWLLGHGLDLSPLLAYVLEVAHYRFDPANGHDYGLTAPNIPQPWKAAKFWQWSGDRGPRIPGCPVDLDRDVYFGTFPELLLWGRAENAREPMPSFPDGPATVLGFADRAEGDRPTDPAPAPDDSAVTSPGTPTSKSQDRLRAIRDPDDPPQGAA